MDECSVCRREINQGQNFCANCGYIGRSAGGNTCPYCLTAMADSEAGVICPECDIHYHRECWQENQGCCVYGCPANPVNQSDQAEVVSSTGNGIQIMQPPFAGYGLQYAGFWKRVAAAVIDMLILYAIYFIIVISIGIIMLAGGDEDLDALEGFGMLAGITVTWLYHALLESSSTQATLGKMALGIKVTDTAGNRIGFGRASGRYFGMFLSGFILNIGFLMVAFTEKKQGLHDMMADCLVVDK